MSMTAQKQLISSEVSDTVCCSNFTYFEAPRLDDMYQATIFTVAKEDFSTGDYTSVFYEPEGSIDGVRWFDLDSITKTGDATFAGYDSANAETLQPLAFDYLRGVLSVDAADSITAKVGFLASETVDTRPVFYGKLTGSNGFFRDSVSTGDTTYFELPRLNGKNTIAVQLDGANHGGISILFWPEVSFNGVDWTRAESAGANIEVGAKAPDNAAEYFQMTGDYPYVRIVYAGGVGATNLWVEAFAKVLKHK